MHAASAATQWLRIGQGPAKWSGHGMSSANAGREKFPGPWAARAGGYMKSALSSKPSSMLVCFGLSCQGPELPRQPLFGGEALEGDVLEWKVRSGLALVGQ